jgi:hypothetical protein
MRHCSFSLKGISSLGESFFQRCWLRDTRRGSTWAKSRKKQGLMSPQVLVLSKVERSQPSSEFEERMSCRMG